MFRHVDNEDFDQTLFCLVAAHFLSLDDVLHYRSNVTRKSVFGVCDQVRLKPVCSANETSYGLEISALASRGITIAFVVRMTTDLNIA